MTMPDPLALNDENAAFNLLRLEARKQRRHASSYVCLAPVAAAKRNEAGLRRTYDCQQARIAEIGGDDRAAFESRDLYDLNITGGSKANLYRVYRFMSATDKSGRQ